MSKSQTKQRESRRMDRSSMRARIRGNYDYQVRRRKSGVTNMAHAFHKSL